MSDVPPPAATGTEGFRSAIEQFLQERLQARLDKPGTDDAQRAAARCAFTRANWIADAARRVGQIQAVTHCLKPVHPDARGTNLYLEPGSLPALDELGSHALGGQFALDVVGNAAALDVYSFLKLESQGRSLLAALLAGDADALQALHDDAAQARALRCAFVGIMQPRATDPGSHNLAKQLYWLTGSDPCTDTGYILLAPLYATSLAQAVYERIKQDRFGEANKAARRAYRERSVHDGVFHDYPGLAVQKMGGANPQSISQLSAERRGVNYLLACLPPQWRASTAPRLPQHAGSVFDKLFGARPGVRSVVRGLRRFLESAPDPNLQARQRRAAFIDGLLDELVLLSGEIGQAMPAGWTLDQERFKDLARAEQLWLDPLRAQQPGEGDFARDWLRMDWPAEIGRRFANWLNDQLAGKLPVGDAEAREWQKVLLGDEDGFVQQLRDLRQRLDALTRTGARQTHAQPAHQGAMQ